MKYLIHERADGGVSITKVEDWMTIDDPHVAQIAKNIADTFGAAPVSVYFCDGVPSSRAFRNAWKKVGSSVSVDMPKAREIKMSQIRAERDVRLKSADKDYMKAISTNSDTEVIAGKMQELRDVPQNTDLESISTPEELEAYNPDWPS